MSIELIIFFFVFIIVGGFVIGATAIIYLAIHQSKIAAKKNMIPHLEEILKEKKEQLIPWENDTLYKNYIYITSINSKSVFASKVAHGFLSHIDTHQFIAFAMYEVKQFYVNEKILFATSKHNYAIHILKSNAELYKEGDLIASYSYNGGIKNKHGSMVASFTFKCLIGGRVDNHEHFKFHFDSGLQGHVVNRYNMINVGAFGLKGMEGQPLYGNEVIVFDNDKEPTPLEEDILLCMFIITQLSKWFNPF